MAEASPIDELYVLVAEALNQRAETLTDDSSPETVGTWDSIASMSLMVLLEETYRVVFSAEEFSTINSVGAIRRILREKGAAI